VLYNRKLSRLKHKNNRSQDIIPAKTNSLTGQVTIRINTLLKIKPSTSDKQPFNAHDKWLCPEKIVFRIFFFYAETIKNSFLKYKLVNYPQQGPS